MNFLEQLIAEWYQYKGYFVRCNVRVSKRVQGGYEGELDIVAYHPITKHLIHIEPSADTDSWETRERRYEKKFRLGRESIPKLFEGLELLKELEQHAVFLFGSKSRKTIGGGDVYLISDILREIKLDLKKKKITNEIVPESFMLLRTLHVFIDQSKKLNE